MKILPLIFAWMMTGCSTLDNQSVQSVTTTRDGATTVTNTPVQDPDKAAFNELCKMVLKEGPL